MPIASHLREFYGRTWRYVTRPQILKRARNRCEQCGVPNQTDVTRIEGCWLEDRRRLKKAPRWRGEHGEILFEVPKGKPRRIRVILSVGHLNHTPGDDDDENLFAFCQYHHLAHDRGKHKDTRVTRKDQARPLFVEVLKDFLDRGQRAQKAVDEIIREAGTSA